MNFNKNEYEKSLEDYDSRKYWENLNLNNIEKVNLTYDFINNFEYNKESLTFEIRKDIHEKINSITNGNELLKYVIYIAALNIQLYAYTGKNESVVGIGAFIECSEDIGIIKNNILPLKLYLEYETDIKNLMSALRKKILEAYENQYCNVNNILKKVNKYNDIDSITPISIVMENCYNKGVINCNTNSTKNEITIFIKTENNNTLVSLDYNANLFKRETIERFRRHYETILYGILNNIQKKVKDIDIITEEEKKKIINDFNNTKMDYPQDKTIKEVFEKQVEITPNGIAVVFEDKRLTYSDLNQKANSLAKIIKEKITNNVATVGIMVEKSFEMIIGVLAILKAGGTYVPIDPQYPKDRIQYILKDSKCRILLTQNHLNDEEGYDIEKVLLDDISLYNIDCNNLPNENNANDVAYIIYTSGSTGQPKGVLIKNKSVINLCKWFGKTYDIRENRNVLQNTSISFDVSVEEIFGSLLNGATIYLTKEYELVDKEKFRRFIDKNNINLVQLVPTTLKELIIGEEKLHSLDVLICGGEALPETMKKEILELGYNLYNCYGPTETTVDAITTICRQEGVVIGKPIDNTRIYILDINGRVQPIGIPGEIAIAGEGVAIGYLNQPQLTAEKFVNNPYEPGKIMYRTGDLGRWLGNGNIEFLGRIDNQVKIRGLRIELGEIENRLLQYKGIKEAVVLVKNYKDKEKYICAYLVYEGEINNYEIREYLKETLPEYMIPSYYIQLDSIPLTTNGKVDKKRLPEVDTNSILLGQYEAPRNTLEEKLAKIWSEVLNIERIGINNNFFELGGHSLKATAVISKIHKELNVEISLKQLFKTSTIKGISEFIEKLEQNPYNSIEKAEEKEYYEVSSAQKRIYMLQQFDLNGIGYNMPGVMIIEGNLDIQRLEKAFNQLIERHETLRTCFETVDEKIVQIVNSEVNFNIDYIDITDVIGEAALDMSTFVEKYENNELDELISNYIRAFSLNKAPLLRVGLIKLYEERYILMFDIHHIISDGISMEILTNEFIKLYEGIELEDLRIQYKDYSEWQKTFMNSEKMKSKEQYWLNKFSDDVPVLSLPTDFARPTVQNFQGDALSFKINTELTSNLKNLVNETNSTMYMVLLSGINILLSKYSGQEDIVIGSPIAGRPHSDLEKIIGMFVNTLAIRNHPEGSKTYEQFLIEVKENALNAFENQDYQFEELVDKLNTIRDVSRNPLFDVMFSMQNIDSEKIEITGLTFKSYKQQHKISKFDLTFSVSELEKELILNVIYSTKLFKKETIEKMIQHFINILKIIVEDKDIKICDIDMLSINERKVLLYEFNNTKTEYIKDKTISELFEEQVDKIPNNIAVVFNNEKLTYKELNNRANKLARKLVEKNTKCGCIIGIVVEPSIETIIGMMAILKTGAAYLPVDLEQPIERIKYMLKDSNVEILLTNNSQHSVFDIITLDLKDETLYEGDDKNLNNNNISSNLSYVIYTSGTTGKPKGVGINHCNLINYVIWFINKVNLQNVDKTVILTSLAFDLSYTSFYSSLLSGCEIHMINKELCLQPEKLINYMHDNEITFIKTTPSLFNIIVNSNSFDNKNKLNKLRLVVLGGEPINVFDVNKIHEVYKEMKVMNHYGPTETTIGAITNLIDFPIASSMIPIGKPISNTQVYILDKYLNILPIGIVGEICIGGDGVGAGYINSVELNYARFVTKVIDNKKLKLYKTGDYGKFLSDGNIQIIGRMDEQVKIRGYRVEIGEIESALMTCNSIKEAVVKVKNNYEDKCLYAYVVMDKKMNIEELKNNLSTKLSDYMIPSYFVQLDKMPLTPNGKIDRNALIEPEEILEEYEAPRNQTEEKLATIWKEILGIKRVGINDNFFSLGGHSLKATILSSRIRKDMQVEVSILEIFKYPTIKTISEYIDKLGNNIYEEISTVEYKEVYEASSAQKRIYMLNQFDNESTVYNMPSVMEVEGILDIEKLKKAFESLIIRHESLRTTFETREEKIVQKINENVNLNLEYIELFKTTKNLDSVDSMISYNKETYDNSIYEKIENFIKNFVRPFNLNKAPLLRVGLIKIKEEKYILMTDMHHIISDGVSRQILMKEFVNFYLGEKLEKLKIQYKDYAEWQNKFLSSEKMKQQEQYWLDRFSGEIPVLTIPTDFIRPSVQSFEGDSIGFNLDKKITKELKKIAKETGSTMYMVLLSAINILLSKYSGEEDIIIGCPIAGRPHTEIENVIGMFVNTLAMRNYPQGNKTYEKFLREVRENSLKAYENQDYQFEELINKLNIRRDISRNPLFDVMFNMNNVETYNMEFKGLNFRQYFNENKVCKFDLNIVAIEGNDEIIFNLMYSSKLFKKKTIENMIMHFKKILSEITINTKVKLNEINMLCDNDYKILRELNNTCVEYKKYKTISEIFEEQVEKTPENIAIVFENNKITYNELNKRANSLAKALQNKGVGENKIVAIIMERSIETIVSILAVLKTGGTYLPIEPEYPEVRINHMLKDSEAKVILIQKPRIINMNIDIMDVKDKNLYENNYENLNVEFNSENLAYIIYTSGTTGTAKGVGIKHCNIINYVSWFKNKSDIHSNDKTIILTSLAFDLSYTSFYSALLSGCEIHIIRKDITLNAKQLVNYMEYNGITLLKLTPSIFNVLVNSESFDNKEKWSKLRFIVIGGEPINAEDVKKVYEKYNHIKIMNHYGPTETTIGSIAKLVNLNENLDLIPIGKPINNTKVYILDKSLNILPVGLPGEICIAGDGLGNGYINRQDIMCEKFIVKNIEGKGVKLYRTGDLGKLSCNGEIEFISRIDNQVKIRGFRVEIGEIESMLLTNNLIKDAIVIDKTDKNGDKYLCAYTVSDTELSIEDLRAYLLKSLPEYMIPSYFIQLEKMPLTVNGKIDKKALMEPDRDVTTAVEYEAARNEKEEKLVAIWQDILGVNKVGISDNFFELGGHSLKAMMVISRIHKELNVDLPLKELFKTPTIKKISAYIENAQENPYASIEISEEKDFYQVSSAQKRMYMLQMFEKDSIAYNRPAIYELDKNANKERIEYTFKKIIERHNVFRTYFETFEDKIVEKIDNDYEFKLLVKQEERNIENIAKEFVRPFCLEKAPLIRMEIVETISKKYILLDIHHIIFDGISFNILMKEFIDIYNGKELEPLKIQYRDFAQWQNKFLESEEIRKQEEYWISRFSDDIPKLNLPYDFKRPAVLSFEGDSINCILDENLTKKLKKLAKQNGSTIYMILLSSFTILLSKYSEQEDIIIGSPIAGRPHADLYKVIGMFINTLAMRNYPKRTKTYEEFLKEVRETALKAYENQDYQFEELIDKLDLRRDVSRNPLFDVMFNMNNIGFDKEIDFKDAILKPCIVERKVSKFDLNLVAIENEKYIELNFEYCTKLFKKETIERMIKHYMKILNDIVLNSKIKLSEIEIITEEEKQKILVDFNNTNMYYRKDKTINQMFEEQVEKTPDNIAVVCEDKKFTYRELNEKSNSLARLIREKGVKPNSIVGIIIDRSLEMLVAIMGVLKSGAAYLPIDSKYPKERINYILEDAKVDLLITKESLWRNEDGNKYIVYMDNSTIYSRDTRNLNVVNKSTDLIYVIYTSGSTGKPKGVMIEHKQVNNFINGILKETFINNYESILCMTNIAFDIFGLETLLPLTQGLKVVVASENEHVDGERLGELIEKNNVEVLQSTPSRLKIILENKKFKEKISNLRVILTGGEELQANLLEELHKYKNIEKFNVYGPTETTIWSTIKKLNEGENITIGKPIINTQIYILNKNNQIVPIGVQGELCIGGDGLSRGYLNREELTAEKFIENPYIKGQRIYKTGDLAKWLEDGDIEFLGRIDNQVKIRGFRIELGEIENRLLQHEDINEAIVLDKNKGNGEKYLSAYLVCKNDINVDEIRTYLKKSLPDYMIPSYFTKLKNIPLTSNGKVNRIALLDVELDKQNRKKIPPNSIQDTLIAEIWKEILGIEEVFIYDDFFELGGNSINIIQVANRIKEKLEIDVTPADLMVHTTIIELSECISNKDSKNSKYKHVFKINNSKSDKKIFIIHGADGDIFYYRYLAKLLESKYSVYGIQPSGLNGKDELPQSYYQMMADYIKEIRMIQNEGPYIIAGYCVGGYLCYDITSVFEMQGEKRGVLIEIDQEAFQKQEIIRFTNKYRRIIKVIDLWRRITRKDKSYTMQKFSDIRGRKHIITKERQMEIIKDKKSIFEFFCKELMNGSKYYFLGKNIKSPTLVIKAKENKNKVFKEELWNKMVDKPVEFYEIPGTHTEVVLPPYVEKVSEIIIDYLERKFK